MRITWGSKGQVAAAKRARSELLSYCSAITDVDETYLRLNEEAARTEKPLSFLQLGWLYLLK